MDVSPLKTGHAFRGIGSYTQNLFESLKKIEQDGQLFVESLGSGHDYDLVHYPYFDLFACTLPIKKQAKTVVTIHDIIPLVFPQHYPPGFKGRLNLAFQKLSLRNVEAVITDSFSSKKDIVQYLRYPERKIYVIPLAPKAIFRKLHLPFWTQKKKGAFMVEYCLPQRFALYVGDVNWNKNLLGLAKACKKISLPLVITGKQAVQENFDRKNIENKPFDQFLTLYKNDPEILRLGFVEDEDLVRLYNLATVYCQPSFYEGFGLPVLEAMACGCPVVTSKTSSLPEIVGKAALLIDPEDYNEIAEKIKQVVDDSRLRKRLGSAGLEQVKDFSWEKTALETVKVYEEVATKK